MQGQQDRGAEFEEEEAAEAGDEEAGDKKVFVKGKDQLYGGNQSHYS